ncbi:hypothetical protein NYE67_16060 [Solibacillus sp. FSL W8-0474]|uniref:hypothetical protein n=1 Tax=Solibacillus sp. FSL W8-0474 TaxID=2975336 RepID=UPI0030FC6B65
MAIILSINLIYAILIWIFFNPEKSLAWLKREKYKDVTEGAIRYTKWMSLIGILMLTLIILVIFILTKIELA